MAKNIYKYSTSTYSITYEDLIKNENTIYTLDELKKMINDIYYFNYQDKNGINYNTIKTITYLNNDALILIIYSDKHINLKYLPYELKELIIKNYYSKIHRLDYLPYNLTSLIYNINSPHKKNIELGFRYNLQIWNLPPRLKLLNLPTISSYSVAEFKYIININKKIFIEFQELGGMWRKYNYDYNNNRANYLTARNIQNAESYFTNIKTDTQINILKIKSQQFPIISCPLSGHKIETHENRYENAIRIPHINYLQST